MSYRNNKNNIEKEKINISKTINDNESSNSFIKNCPIFEFPPLSFKSDEEQNDIQNRKNKRNDIIDNSLASNIKVNHKKKVYESNYFQEITDKLYYNDEHLNKKKKIQRKNVSLNNVIKLKEILFLNSNTNRKTSMSKKNRNKKKKKKSLFQDKLNIKKEEGKINIKNLRQSLTIKSNLGENKNKHKKNNFGSFLKMKPKDKYPVKESFIDSILKKSVNSKAYSIIRNNNENKEQSYKSNKKKKKFILNSEKNVTKVEEEKEIPVLDKSNTTHNNIKIYTEIDSNCEQNKKHNKQKVKWKMVNYCCCLSSGCI